MKKKYSILLLSSFFTLGVLASCANKTTTSETTTTINEDDLTYVENYKLDSERKYTGWLYNGLPEKEGTLTWVLTNCVYTGQFHNGKYEGEGLFEWKEDGNKLEGTFKDDAPTYGTFTYVNTMKYVGEFNKQWQFEGQGTFDWNTYNKDGSIKEYGWLYEGEFKEGSPKGCVGKVTFTCARDGRGMDGVYWFEGVMSGFPQVKSNQKGKGCIHYQDLSVYTGDILYTGTDWLRKGYGEQYFFPSRIGVSGAFGATEDEYLYKYVGEFDANVSGWIYGNGIMYYANKKTEAPTRWSKGFFSACHLLKPYEKEKIDLLDGYTGEMETPYLRFREDYDKYMKRINGYEVQHHKFVFAGDSYMTFMNIQSDTPFAKYFGKYDAIDVGCGGSTSGDWLNYYKDLILPYTPEYIVMHIGGNDLSNQSSKEIVFDNLKALINEVKKDLPSTKIIMISQWANPTWLQSWEPRRLLNEEIKKLANEEKALDYIDVSDLVYNNETHETIPNLESYFREDKIHMNDAGYLLWANRVCEYLDTL